LLPPILLGLIGIAIAISVPAISAAFAIITVSKAMAGAGTEKPEILTKAMIAIVLAEAIAIYGLLSAFMLLGKLGGIQAFDAGMTALTAGIAIAVSSLAGGLGIGYAGSSMIVAMAERPETFSKNVIGVVLAEAIAIYGLLVSFILIGRI
jgi:F0F1-type ATP synthase membrane subunit c/vacuolar-type H+-ATPase subunit K